MKITELRCSACDGTLKIDEKNPNIAVCEYCKSRFIIEREADENVTMRGLESIWYQPNPHQPNAHQPGTRQIPAPQSGGSRTSNGIKKAGKDSYGWKQGIILGAAVIAAILLLNGKVIFGWIENKQATKTVPQTEVNSGLGDKEAANREEIPMKPELTGGLAAFAETVFEKPADQITMDEMAQLKCLEIRSTLDDIRIGYRFDNPYETKENGLKWVTFPKEEAKVDPTQFRYFTGLIVLKTNNYVSKADIEGLKLEGFGCRAKSLVEAASLLNDPGSLKELELQGGLESLKGTERFANLEHLSLYGGHLTDLANLVQLKNLKALKLENFDDVTDFTFLSVMPQLEELYVQSEGIRDIGFVEGMANLKKLTISHANVLNLDGLSGKESLTSLTVERCYEMKDCSSVSGLINLEELSLEVPHGCEKPNPGNLTKLKMLRLKGFEKTSFIRNLGALESLSLEGCGIDDPDAFSNLVNLKELNCSHIYGDTAGWRFAAKLPALMKLDLTGVATYEDVSGLFGIPTLETLILNGMECEINFDKLKDNPVLKHLEMNGIKLYKNVKVSGGGGITLVDYDKVNLDEHTDFIAAYTGLEQLSITGNKLTQLNFAASLPELRALDISDNYITDLKPLELLMKLKTVNCTGNPISNYQILNEDVQVIK